MVSAESCAAEVLAEHDDAPGWTCDEGAMPVYECQCGARSPEIAQDWIGPEEVAFAAAWHRAHVAAALAAAGCLADDREGETVTEWETRSIWRGCRCGHPGAGCCCSNMSERTGRTRQRTRFPDVVTDWSPDTPDGGDQQ